MLLDSSVLDSMLEINFFGGKQLLATYIGVRRLRIFGGPRFRILGGGGKV